MALIDILERPYLLAQVIKRRQAVFDILKCDQYRPTVACDLGVAGRLGLMHDGRARTGIEQGRREIRIDGPGPVRQGKQMRKRAVRKATLGAQTQP